MDHGLRRTGLAVSDPLGLFARPLLTLDARRDGDVPSAVAAVAAEQDAVRILVGLPRLPSGDLGEQADAVLAFVQRLKAALAERGLRVPVLLWDESHSSADAAARLAARGRRPEDSPGGLDAAAAAMILESWLAAGAPEAGEGDDDGGS